MQLSFLAGGKRRLFGYALGAGILALVDPITAHAEFGNCAAPGFLGGVDDRMGDVALPCDEAVRFTIETPGGPRQVRIIYSTEDLAPNLLQGVADIHNGVERAAAALRGIGQGTTADITIWASDRPAPEGADAEARPIGDADSECVVAMYRGGDTPFVVAHEFFHCVQYATYGDKTYAASSDWWAEGSAEWFANFAVAGRSNSDGDVALFDSASPETALTSMNQEAVVFFFWLSKNFGASMVMAVMEAMPNGGEGAQQDALARLLAPEDFQRFAEDYLDRNIAQPGGRSIPSNPFRGDIYVWDESTEHEFTFERFVLARARLEFACGEWSIERRDEEGTWHISRDEGPWMDMEERLSIPGPDAETIRMAAFGTGGEGFRVTVEATRNPCEQCRQSITDREVLACLTGTWQLASGGLGAQIEEALRASGQFQSIDYPDIESVLVLNPDGTFEYPGPEEDYNAEVQTEGGDLFRGFGSLAIASHGQWSVDGDTLHMCVSPPEVRIDLTIIDPDGNEGRLQTSGGPDSSYRRSRSFTCEPGSLTLVEGAAIGPRTTWHYTR